MAVSRRTFEAVAKVIHDERERMIEVTGHSIPVTAVAMGIAAHFAEENPRFDREQFLRACGFSRVGAEVASSPIVRR